MLEKREEPSAVTLSEFSMCSFLYILAKRPENLWCVVSHTLSRAANQNLHLILSIYLFHHVHFCLVFKVAWKLSPWAPWDSTSLSQNEKLSNPYINVVLLSFSGVFTTTVQQPGPEPRPDIHWVHSDLGVECGSQCHILSSHLASDCGLFLYWWVLWRTIPSRWQACVQDFVLVAWCALYIPTLQKWKPQY